MAEKAGIYLWKSRFDVFEAEISRCFPDAFLRVCAQQVRRKAQEWCKRPGAAWKSRKRGFVQEAAFSLRQRRFRLRTA